ncbi:nuclear transport factor 2 family protein [Sphingosinicella sp. YJ22]|uniref:nuclear transport factor 2 family protein n=1 Tax=Sphingosinicella sp. YJ22 TaxID=1104780 RepID=UPI001409617B|nr:nuclear transport factor 2 family protein [Sphingosinicella sp. YJ22]
MSQENVATVRRLYDAFAAGDVDTIITLMSPDIEWSEAENFPYADNSPYHGPEAVLTGVFGRLGTEWHGFGAHPEEFIDGGDTIVVLGRYSGSCVATGNAMNPQMAHVLRVTDGRITSFRQYVDTLAVARATGAA